MVGGGGGAVLPAPPYSYATNPTFPLGTRRLNRLGFGAMRIVGKEIWGPPADRGEALRTLRRLPALGINFIDTANSYGPDISEELIREALYPYEGLCVASKSGLVRISPEDRWMDCRPEHLIAEAKRSCDKLGVDSLDLWQLHRIDGEVPVDEQFGAIRAMLDEGIIRHAGLCEVSVPEIEAASKVFPVSTVQNRYNFLDRKSEAVLAHCTAQGIGFIAWYPLRAGMLAGPGSPLAGFAARRGVTPGQLALAYLLHASPVMLPIPGTGRAAHLEENAAAADIRLSEAEMRELSALRYPARAG
jgi:aryl-alcohol dehydrogenase-like predicted oxidoreductase